MNQPLDIIIQLRERGTTVNLSAIARRFVKKYAGHAGGYVQLRCECGEGDVVIDRLASDADVAELVDLMQHALFDHISPRRIEETRVCDDLSVADLEPGAFSREGAFVWTTAKAGV